MTKKFLIIVLLAVILIFAFTINSYAYSSPSFSCSKYGVDLPDVPIVNINFEPKYSMFIYYANRDYLYLVSEKPLSLVKNQWGYLDLVRDGKCIYSMYDTTYNRWGSYQNYSNTMKNLTKSYLQSGVKYCNYDIKYNNTYYVFATGTTPLAKTFKTINNYDSVTSEIIYILPVVLFALVGFIGIRKSIAFIQNKLHNA